MYLSFNYKIDEVNELQNDKKKAIYFFDDINEPIILNQKGFIGDFRQINFFIGSNNSGKSRFLRGILKLDVSSLQVLKTKKNFYDEFQDIQKTYNSLSENNLNDINSKELRNTLKKIHDKYNFFSSANNGVFYSNLVNNFSSNIPFFEDVESLKEELLSNYNKINFNGYKRHYQEANEFLNIIQEFFNKLKYSNENKISNFIYIPVLRSLTKSEYLNVDSFEKVTKENYSIKKEVFSGLTFYTDLSKKKNTEISERKKVKEFEKFLSNVFFDNKDVEITSYSGVPSSILFSLDGTEFPIHNIGDGIQMLILLLLPIFTAKDNTWFFVEEPETHLHPGLQRIFIETLLNDEYLKTKKLRYFFTTHSNHFLDLSLQTDKVSFFQFQKESQEKFKIKSVKPNKEILDLLGVNNSSVLMANCSIWVEGPTDRKYISKFLKLYCEQNKNQHLKEDIDFAFLEYGGNLIAHYLFDEDFDDNYNEKDVKDSINAFSLANKIYLLADNDNPEINSVKEKRRKNLEKISSNKYNFKYQNTNYREIENLLPVKIIKDFLIELVKPNEANKVDKINFSRSEYISIGLGDFIKSLFDKNEIKNYKGFRDESGTLKSSYKTKLCEFVINGNYTYDDLIYENKQLDEIMKSLYNFIKPK